MKTNQINISHAIVLTPVQNTANKNNDGQGGNFSFAPSRKEIYPLSRQKLHEVEQNLRFILSHQNSAVSDNASSQTRRSSSLRTPITLPTDIYWYGITWSHTIEHCSTL